MSIFIFFFFLILIFIYCRVYATETSQFLAPYESSMKPRSNESPPTVPASDFPIAPPGYSASSTDVSRTVGPDNRSLSADIADWNPFEEPPFSQMTEDHIFGAEFDKIRRGSQSSKSFFKINFENSERI